MNTMTENNQVKKMVQEKYAAIASQQADENRASCCGATGCGTGTEVYNIMSDDYTELEGYNKDADLGLGCGLPTEYAHIKEGDTVLDLGSGAGNDCFIARRLVGESGKVLGIDFTPEMLRLARANAEKLGFENIEFYQGDIENMPLKDGIADVVVSNCVLNLVPHKENVFKEIFRVLKPGAHFSISDIVLEGALPGKWKEVAELYAGCVSGAIQKDEYLDIIKRSGFENVEIQKGKIIQIPDSILQQYLTAEETEAFKNSGTRISSITVNATRPSGGTSCCAPGCCD
ncbi:MAG: arsenite methyltransferase [Ferruginibacter sp.]